MVHLGAEVAQQVPGVGHDVLRLQTVPVARLRDRLLLGIGQIWAELDQTLPDVDQMCATGGGRTIIVSWDILCLSAVIYLCVFEFLGRPSRKA